MMGKLRIAQLTLGPVSTNCYFLINEETKETVLIDPPAEAARIMYKIRSEELSLSAILLTHGHFDHIMAADEVKEETGAKIYAIEQERIILEDAENNGSPMVGAAVVCKADQFLRDHQKLSLAGFTVEVIHTPGHTIGSVCYYLEEEGVLISGDTLFEGSCGRTDLATGSMSAIIQSIKRRLFVLPDNVKVYPGHGEATTIGYEKLHNFISNY